MSGHHSRASPLPSGGTSASHVSNEVGNARVERTGNTGEGAKAWVRLSALNSGEMCEVGGRALRETRAARTTAIAKLAYACAGDDGRAAFEVGEHACILA